MTREELDEDEAFLRLSEESLAEDWNSEEDEVWDELFLGETDE